MLKFKIMTALILLSAHLGAQSFSITGSVRDGKSNQVLESAIIQIDGTNRFTVTDAFGRFHLEKIPTGEQVLIVRLLGYEMKAEKVSVSANVQLDILMDESLTITDEVVISATRANEKTPATYTNVDKESIRKQNFGQDLPFLLNWTPSVVTTSDAGTGIGYTGIRIRGSDATRVNVTINGIPYNDSESQGTFWVDIPDVASSTQSIQIQRGVGTSTNGAGAFGATINLQTNSRQEEPYAEIMSAAGSFGTFRNTLSFGTGVLRDKWVIDGRLSSIQSDGFIDRATADLKSYYFSAGYYAGKTMIKALAFGGKERTYQAWYGVPESKLNNDTEAMLITAMNEEWNELQTENLLTSATRTFNPYLYKNQVDDYRQDHYQLHFSQQLSEGVVANLAFHYTPGSGYYEEYRFDDEFANYGLSPVTIGGSTIESCDIIRRRWLDNDFYGATYSLNYDTDRLSLTFGGAWNRYDGDHFGEIIWAEVSPVPTEYQYYFNNGDKRDFNVFTKATYDFNSKLSGYLDLQYRTIGYATSGIENKQNTLDVTADFHFFNPKAGLMYKLNGNQQLYTSVSVANREPVRDDFVDAPGNAPKPERLVNLETGYRISGSNFLLNINYYLMSYRDQLVLTGQLNDVGASVRTNVDKSYRMGIEVEGAFKLSDQVTWSANLTLSQNKIKEFNEVLYDYGADFDEYNEVIRPHNNTDISFSPSVIGGSTVAYAPFHGAEFALLTKYVSRQYLDNTTNADRSIDAYVVNDVRLSYKFHPSFMKELSLSLLVNNILSETYESNGYTWGYLGGGAEYREDYYYPQAGRNFMVMLNLKF